MGRKKKATSAKQLMNPMVGAPPMPKKGKRQTAADKKGKGY